MTEKTVIAIDGPAASGKGTLARKIARHFDFAYLDTGKLYRLVGLRVLEAGLDPDDENEVNKKAYDLVGQFKPEDLDNPDLGTDEAGNAASRVAVHLGVRQALIELQRYFPQTTDKRGAVIDGRDIGTVIYPDADLKIFVTADIQERARRRCNELKSQGRPAEFEKILQDMKARDDRDTGRALAPTRKAEDAVEVDTTEMSINEMVEKVAPIIQENLK